MSGAQCRLGDTLAGDILHADQSTEAGINEQRQRVMALRQKLGNINTAAARRLELIADYLVEKSVWLIGGDGWAYDIGFGGLDHVISMPRKVNILVLDTEVYSNTGGQASKSTPIGAAAKFAAAGKATNKKDLGLIAMSYGHVYVASVAFGAKDTHTVQAFQEAASYPGPALIIAYSQCVAHGYDRRYGAEQQKLAVKLSPFYSSLAHFAKSLDGLGINALVLFNRFYQPDINIEELEVERVVHLSASEELLLRLRWLAILSGRLTASLAATSGVHTAIDAIKAVMTGAHAVQIVSALLRHGPEYLTVLRQGMAKWLEEHEYDSLRQMQSSMSLLHCDNPRTYERANYIRILQSWEGNAPYPNFALSDREWRSLRVLEVILAV